MPIPEVRLGQPEFESNYDFYESDTIKVYISNSLKPIEDSIHIRIVSFLWMKSFGVTGF